MNLEELSKSIVELTSHSAKCGGVCFLHGEIQHAGLAVVLAASCNKCMQEFTTHLSTWVTASQSASKKWSINLAAVLSQMATGGGHARLNNVLTTMGVPGMQKACSNLLKSSLERLWRGSCCNPWLRQDRKREIKQLPTIIFTKVCHTSVLLQMEGSQSAPISIHNAKSGVAVIFGLYTKKLLFLGVRNKYCSVCSMGKSLNNVLATAIGSCAMESDIVAEGFRLTHGIRFLKLVGDGDSSVLATIHQRRSYVENFECANHAKC